MASFFAAAATDSIPATLQSDSAAVGQRRCSDVTAVSAGLHDLSPREIEDRLDAVIREFGGKAEEAMAAGDPTGARLWCDRMVAAIKSRSPAHKARLHDELEQRLNDGVDYMQAQGRLAAELLAKRGQA